MKNAGMTGALVLIGAGLFTNAFMANTPTVQAVPASVAVAAAVQDKGEPTIVWMDQTTSAPFNPGAGSTVWFWRMWSDGRIEGRTAKLNNVDSLACGETGNLLNCSATSDWMELPAPPGGEGYACRSDVNGDRRVDGIDLAPLLSQCGDGVSCDPQPTYPCFDLGNLNLPAG